MAGHSAPCYHPCSLSGSDRGCQVCLPERDVPSVKVSSSAGRGAQAGIRVYMVHHVIGYMKCDRCSSASLHSNRQTLCAPWFMKEKNKRRWGTHTEHFKCHASVDISRDKSNVLQI